VQPLACDLESTLVMLVVAVHHVHVRSIAATHSHNHKNEVAHQQQPLQSLLLSNKSDPHDEEKFSVS